MPILKNVQTMNGITAAHKVVRAILSEGSDTFQLQVHSYVTEEDMRSGMNLLGQEYATAAISAFDPLDPMGGFERALLADSSSKWASGTWIEAQPGEADLQTLKDRKWAEIKAKREKSETSGFEVEGLGRFDSDPKSRNQIVGAVTAAHIALTHGVPYSISWTLEDNSSVELDAPAMINVGMTLLAEIDKCHQKSRGLYAQIEAAETAEEVAAINW